jgi:polyhydroxyalkanoate synthesis regulator phasin
MPAPKPSSSSGGNSKPTAKRASTARSAASGAKGTATSARKGASRTATQAKSAATKTSKAAQSGAKKTAQAARSGGARSGAAAGTAARSTAKTTRSAQADASATSRSAKAAATKTTRAAKSRGSGVADGLANLAEELANRIINPLDLVMLTRERIQETLDDAVERGRVTRDDANELVSDLVRRGRQQTEDILTDVEQLVGKGRDQIGTVTKRARRTEPVDRIVRTADRARRTVGVGPSFPILGYDDLTAGQVDDRLGELTLAELRKVRDYERRHANRKSVLAAIEKKLG